MQEYELTVLIHPDLESDMEKPLSKVQKIVTDAGGEITNDDDWGRRKLAYPIRGEHFAVYHCLTINVPAAAPDKISSVLNITDEVLRYLLVKIDPKKVAALAEENSEENTSKESEE